MMEFLFALQQIRNPVLDVLCKMFTTMGEEAFLMVVFCLLAWCVDKPFAHRLGFAFCTGMGINQVLKITFCVRRPWVLNPGLTVSPLAEESATGYSFPSGHTQSGVTVFGGLARNWCRCRPFAALCVLCAAGIGFSRMYFGVHTPADVLASVVIGVLVIFTADALWRRCERHPAAALCVGLALSVGMTLYALYKSYPPYHLAHLADDCIKIAGAISGFFIGWYAEQRWLHYKTAASVPVQVLKLLLGIAGLLVLKWAVRSVPQGVFMMFAGNLLLILWCVLLWPWVFEKIRNRKITVDKIEKVS